ncbi:kanadaptin [Engystomops pustulosus]|uniref:kanadaptin n=1 Tax=Engystomops pustulosus TaxID=76066 RepID=UPI003AFA08FD
MQAVQLSPHGGERPHDPGAMEAGDTGPNAGNETSNDGHGGAQGSQGTAGPCDPGAASYETTGGRDAGSRDDETPRARYDEGSRSPRAATHEGAASCSAEGSTDPGAGSAEAGGTSRTPWHPPRGDPGAQRIEGSRSGSDETTGGPRTSCSSGTNPTPSEEPGDDGAISSRDEEPPNARDGAHAPPDDAGECTERFTGPHGAEGPYDTRTCTQGTDDVSPAERSNVKAQDPTEHDEGGDGARGSPLESSFKKPVTPSRSSRNEKTLDQHDKPSSCTPASPQLSAPISNTREASPDHSARLPSDAYRASPAIPYQEPAWSGLPPSLYTLEVLKGGSILSTKDLDAASWTVFGRLPTCHVPLEHPSVSRYHAVLQYRSVPGSEPDQEPGFYVYDLGSTHGTFINKQRIQPKTYCRFRVGHVMKFGGSTRLFILQGPDEDQEAESEMTVTQIKEARRQKESLQKRMLGDDSDDDSPEEEGEEKAQRVSEDTGCMWGMGEDAEEEENDVNPIALEYQAEREASYSGNPKKALQGYYDREGEELDFEYEDRGVGSWLCRVKLPVDDSSGKQLTAEVVHTGKKKDAMRLCCMEACRMLDMRGLLRQEAVSRKRKAKQWEAEDFYDSDDDTFLDRTGIVEKKRLNRMKKAGKIEEKPETYESLTTKLDLVEKEIMEIAAKLKTNRQDDAQTSAQDSLDAFMTEMKSSAPLDSVTRKKLHIQSLELRKEQQRLKSLIKIVQPTRLPELKSDSAGQDAKAKKPTLPMFGAMKGGSKFKLKTGTVGRVPPKRTDLPSSLFTMKGEDNEPEEEEEEEEEDEEDGDRMQVDTTHESPTEGKAEQSETPHPGTSSAPPPAVVLEEPKKSTETPGGSRKAPTAHSPPAAQTNKKKAEEEAAPKAATVRPKKMLGPSRPPQGALSSTYPEDDPDYCVWTPPTGQTGDGKTHLNEKFGY